jgi:HAE1 family hydrophobic/amphiphilic exporter-1
MQKLAEICIRRPVFATMIVLSLVVVGAAGYFRLGVDRFPAVDLPTVSVRVGLPGASPEEVESLITQQVEEVINTVDGISELRSVSGQGTSLVIATFRLDRNLESAAQDVRDRVNTLGRQLPEDATPPVVQKFDNDSTPVLTIALTADRSIRELTELADKTARPQLERIAGVGEVRIVGGLDRAINVWIDAERLAAYQIPIAQIRQALERQNTDVPGGNVTTGKEELTLRTLGRFTDPRQFDDLVIANVNGAPVRLRDVGRVEDGTKEQRSFSRLNGVPTVTLDIRRQSGGEHCRSHQGFEISVAARRIRNFQRRQSRNHPRSVALHRSRAARDPDTPRARQYSREPRRARVHAFMAVDVDRSGRDPVLRHFDVRHDESAQLHAQ